MAQWKRRRPSHQTAEGIVGETEDPQFLRQEFAHREEEVRFLRAQLAQALAGWREAQQQLFALEAAADTQDAPR